VDGKRSRQGFIPARQGLAGGLRPDFIGTTPVRRNTMEGGKNWPLPDGSRT